MKIIAAVILYNPDESVVSNIQTYSGEMQKTLVFDNSKTSNQHLCLPLRNCVYSHDGKNRGIAKRLNQACQFAIENNFDFILTMDQDSFFEEGMLSNYLSCIQNYNCLTSTAMYGADYHGIQKQAQCTPVNVDQLITSGSVINIEIYKKLGGFDENLFIDEVDHEYCYRALMNDYKVVKMTNIFMNHTMGILARHRSLKSFKVTGRRLHPPIRLYYMVRNFLYVSNKYQKRLPKSINRRRKDLFVQLKNNLLYNKERLEVIKYILKGYQHYRQKKWGKLE